MYSNVCPAGQDVMENLDFIKGIDIYGGSPVITNNIVYTLTMVIGVLSAICIFFMGNSYRNVPDFS